MSDPDPNAATPEPSAPPPVLPAKPAPPATLTDLQELIGAISAEKILYFSATGKLLDPVKAEDGEIVRKYDRAGVLAIKIRPLRDEEMVEISKLTDIDPPKKSAKQPVPGQPAPTQIFGEEYDFLDAEYQLKMSEGRRLRRAAIICAGLVELKIPGDKLSDKADFLSKNFKSALLTFLQDEIEAISSGEIKALELASFT